MSKKLSLTRFTPAQAAKVTGLSVAMQRDYRKRHYLPANEGHARFECFDLAEQKSLRMLSDRGIGPAFGKSAARAIAYGVVSHALLSPQAYDFDVTAESLDASRREILGAAQKSETRLPANSSRLILNPPRFFIWWSDDSKQFVESLDQAVDERSPARPAGPTVFLDIRAEATDLLREAGVLVNQVGA